jgi:hypothetical protein
MLKIELNENDLYRHERIVLERCASGILLPVSCVCEVGRVCLLYATEGYVSLAEHGFRGDLASVFRALKGYAHCLTDAQDMLLQPEKVFRDAERIFIRAADGAVRAVYGRLDGDEGGGTKGAYVTAMLPLLGELSKRTDIVGAKAAMTQTAKKIRSANPGSNELLKILEMTERQWNCIQPPEA